MTPAENHCGRFMAPKRVVRIAITLNGRSQEHDVPANLRLIEFLRDRMRLTGTHAACETGQCGACTILVDGIATKSCSILAASCDGADILTVEGLAKDGELHPMQAAFREQHGLQCGFCTPGMIMIGIDIVCRYGEELTPELVREELEGNLCRCTGYENIVRAILTAASKFSSGRQAEGEGRL